MQSASLPVTGGAQYDLYAWVRGKLDADDSASSFYLRLRFYDSSGALIPYDSGHNAHSGSPESLDGVWRYSGGRVTAPPNAAAVQILLLNHFNTGWVTFDDVSLTRVGQETVIKRSSYGIAGQIAAIRVSGDPVSGNDGISYFYNDHLGSNTALRKPDGSRVSTYYLPFGGYRPGSAPTQAITDRDFTGQRENMELGLLYYQARFYVPAIGRFASADTIIPDPANPQSYNRYSYVRNRVLNFTDPTGHRECGASDDCSDPLPRFEPPPVQRLWIDEENVDRIQLYGNTNFAFNLGTENAPEQPPSYAYSQGFHGGIDLIADPGTTVHAGVYGIVEYVDDWQAYKPRYIKIKIGPDTYIIIGHLSADSDIQLKVGQQVQPDTVVGTVSEREWHVHVEFWDDSGTLTLRSPYSYMSSEVKEQFFALMANMNESDSRISFHNRSDGLWQSTYAQPSLLYGKQNPNLNEGQPGYNNPWD